LKPALAKFAEELSLTTAELSYLQERRQAFENLGRRTGIAAIKAVATVLIRGTLWHPGRPGAARDGVGEP
jgi:pilus assembly protein TadC